MNLKHQLDKVRMLNLVPVLRESAKPGTWRSHFTSEKMGRSKTFKHIQDMGVRKGTCATVSMII